MIEYKHIKSPEFEKNGVIGKTYHGRHVPKPGQPSSFNRKSGYETDKKVEQELKSDKKKQKKSKNNEQEDYGNSF